MKVKVGGIIYHSEFLIELARYVYSLISVIER